MFDCNVLIVSDICQNIYKIHSLFFLINIVVMELCLHLLILSKCQNYCKITCPAEANHFQMHFKTWFKNQLEYYLPIQFNKWTKLKKSYEQKKIPRLFDSKFKFIAHFAQQNYLQKQLASLDFASSNNWFSIYLNLSELEPI